MICWNVVVHSPWKSTSSLTQKYLRDGNRLSQRRIQDAMVYRFLRFRPNQSGKGSVCGLGGFFSFYFLPCGVSFGLKFNRVIKERIPDQSIVSCSEDCPVTE